MRDEMTALEQQRQKAAQQAAEMSYLNKGLADCNQTTASPAMNECERQSARGAIEQRCENLLREANGLRALLSALPQDMSQAAEEALWKLAVGR